MTSVTVMKQGEAYVHVYASVQPLSTVKQEI